MAIYRGRKVTLNKPQCVVMLKSSFVFVKKAAHSKVKKVSLGSKKMSIKKNIPASKKSFWHVIDVALLVLKQKRGIGAASNGVNHQHQSKIKCGKLEKSAK